MDLAVWAGVLNGTVFVAGTGSVVALHQTRVDDTIVGGLDTHTTIGLLHNDGQDETSVNTAGGSNCFDGLLHIGVLVVGVIRHAELSTARGHDSRVGLEHIVKGGDPLGDRGPPIRYQTITTKNCFVKIGTACIEGRTGLCICRLLVEIGCYRRPRNEGEAAGSQKLFEFSISIELVKSI